MTTARQLPESETLSDGDLLIVSKASNSRTRSIAASDAATYFNAALKGASIQYNTATSVITMTLGDGFVITGTVTGE
jgi:hypothetical protein